MYKIFLRHTLRKKIILTFLILYLYTFSLYENASLIQLLLQLIRYARASSNYSDFLKHHLHLRNTLLDQGYKKICLIRSLKKFIFSSTKPSEANVKNNFTSHIDKKNIFDIFVDLLIFIFTV
jgi:hypothetical protein